MDNVNLKRDKKKEKKRGSHEARGASWGWQVWGCWGQVGWLGLHGYGDNSVVCLVFTPKHYNIGPRRKRGKKRHVE